MDIEFDAGKVLVVDDDKEFLGRIVRGIEDNLHLECVFSRDGEKALRKFSEHRPALVVLDMMLPKKSGFMVMELISKMTGKKKNPRKLPLIIMVTGNLDRRHQFYAENMGTWRYLIKPFKTETLLDLVRRARQKAEKLLKTR